MDLHFDTRFFSQGFRFLFTDPVTISLPALHELCKILIVKGFSQEGDDAIDDFHRY